MEQKNIEGYENYILYENGDIYNKKNDKYVKVGMSSGNYRVKLANENGIKSFFLLRMIYEIYYNEKLTNNYIIRLKTTNINDKFHYKNLEKIKRVDMFKKNNYQLDISKEWKSIKNYDEYQISNCGDIFSIKSNKFLIPTKDTENYLHVKLIKNNKRSSFLVHRLVFDTFKNIINIENVIDHIDRNPSNNNIDNLREISKSENSLNREFPKIETNKIIQYTLTNKFIKEWNSITEIITTLNYNSGHISNCANGKIKSAYGFIWKNVNHVIDVSKFREIITDDNKKYSNYKINENGQIINKNNILMKYKLQYGYYSIELVSDDTTYKCFRVNRLVALTFLNNYDKNNVVNHIDKNKLNNNVNNLEWVSHKQNITHSQGKKINQINLKTNEVIKLHLSMTDAYRDLNKTYGANIRLVCEGKRKSAFGFKWEFC